MTRAKLPLNRDAVAKANDEFYARHPEMVRNGKRVALSPTDPGQAGLRKEWMAAYVAHGGRVESPGRSTGKPDDPVAPCPGKDTLPAGTPKNCEDAPKTVTFPKDLNDQFDARWNASFPNGKSQEQGGTLVRDKEGQLKMINTNPPGLNSGSFPADRGIPDGYSLVGVFHTHPYDESEGGATDVSLSGGDSAYMINNADQVIIAQSGKGQFMMMRTQETPSNVDFKQVDDEQNARISELMTRDGKSFSEASQMAAKETAQKYGMAYYEGNGGVFQRVDC